MRWPGHVAHIGESRDTYSFWRDNLRKTAPLEDLGVYGRIILKWVLKKKVGGPRLDLSVSEEGQVVVFCEYGNEPSGSIKFLY